MEQPARIAILGIELESNAFAPVTTEADFHAYHYAEGKALEAHLREAIPFKFIAQMDALRPWEMAPILHTSAGAGGPCDHAFYLKTIERIEALLAESGRIDAVCIVAHGAGTTTELDDLDGDYFARVRACVGPHVPIVAVLDLHANVSEAMIAATDALISFLTNPHIDQPDRWAEAARVIDLMLRGEKSVVAHRRLPLITPQVMQLTAPGEPYGDLIAFGQSFVGQDVFNVSILSGFAFSDTSYNGMTILVHAWGQAGAAEAAADAIAHAAWDGRHRYRRVLLSVEEAVEAARTTPEERRPIILADVADNPGGGGRGNTMWLVEALIHAKAEDVQIGVIYDEALAAEAHALGEGGVFLARFNRDESDQHSKPFAAYARVRRLTDGRFRGRHGGRAGYDVNLGASALLEIGGVAICVISIRQQIWGADFLEHFGLAPETARTIVVKSRGHFRAGFAHIAPPDRIFEVDAPGLTTPNLSRVAWRRLPRPSYPLDLDMVYDPRPAHRPISRSRT